MVVTIGIVLYGGTTLAGMPTASTFARGGATTSATCGTCSSRCRRRPRRRRPFLLLAALGLWWAAFVADWAAFRLWVPFEAILPAGTVFVFSSLFASQRRPGRGVGDVPRRRVRVPPAAPRHPAAVERGLGVERRAARHERAAARRRGTRGARRARRGRHRAQPAAGAIRSARRLAQRRGRRPELADDRQPVRRDQEAAGRPVQPRAVHACRASQRSYWRLTSLDQFDGNVWSSNGSYERATGSLPHRVPSDVDTVVAEQAFSIVALDTIWLPAAFEPRSINAGNTAVRYEPDSSTLIVGTSLPNSNGVQLHRPVGASRRSTRRSSSRRDRSAAARLVRRGDASCRPTSTRGCSKRRDGRRRRRDDAVRHRRSRCRTTSATTSPTTSTCRRARATTRSSTSSSSASAATASSSPARSRRWPGRSDCRPGSRSGSRPARRTRTSRARTTCKGLHAHAWPEVFISGQGWVPFEPTPTRGAPNAQQYTHVPEQQATDGGGATTVPTTPAPTTPTTAGATGTTQPAGRAPGRTTTPATTAEPSFWSTHRFGGRALIGGGGAAGVWRSSTCSSCRSCTRLYRRRRRKAATEPDDQVRLAWQESVEAAQTLGVAPWRSETAAEFGHRADRAIGARGVPGAGRRS